MVIGHFAPCNGGCRTEAEALKVVKNQWSCPLDVALEIQRRKNKGQEINHHDWSNCFSFAVVFSGCE